MITQQQILDAFDEMIAWSRSEPENWIIDYQAMNSHWVKCGPHDPDAVMFNHLGYLLRKIGNNATVDDIVVHANDIDYPEIQVYVALYSMCVPNTITLEYARNMFVR